MELTIRFDVEPTDPNQVPHWISKQTTDQYFQVAVATLLIYDTITTMDKEVRYFWTSPRKAVNVVYFLNRYFGILGGTAFLFWNAYSSNLTMCKFSLWTFNATNWFSIVLTDYILMIRVLALYHQVKNISICLKTLLVLAASFKFGLFIYLNILEDVVVSRFAEGLAVCGVNVLLPTVWGLVDWKVMPIPIAYGVILMALALYKAMEFWRTSAGFGGFILVKVLVRDQLIYFTLVVLCCAINVLQFKVHISNTFLAGVLSTLGTPSFLSVLGSRMLFNMKEAGERGRNGRTSYRLGSMSDMEFY